MNDKNQNASERILYALNDVDEELIEEAAPLNQEIHAASMNAEKKDVVQKDVVKKEIRDTGKKKKRNVISFLNHNWKKFTAIAAGLALVVVGSTSALNQMNKSKSDMPYRDSFSYVGNSSVDMTNEAGWMGFDAYEEEKGWVDKSEGFSGGLAPNEANPGDVGMLKPGMEQKLIYTATVRLETLEFDDVICEIKDKITELGGFIETDEIYDSSNGVWYNDSYEKKKGTMTENLTIRIPADRYNEFLQAASNVNGKVTSLVQNVENITREYSDLATTIESLKTQETRLLEMMKEAETIEDMIYVEARLSEVQNELRIYQNHLNEMDTDVAYSTVHLKISEVVKYTNTPTPKSTFLERLQNTLSNSGEGFLSFMENSLFFLITILPEALLAAGIILVVVIVVKSRKKKRAGHKPDTKEENEDE